MNPKLIDKYCAVERAIVQEKGELTLLVLLELEESPGGWDFVLSADWLPEYTGETLIFVIDKLKAILESQYYQISNIIFLRPDEPFIRTFQAFLDNNPQQREFSNLEILGLAIKRAYVIVPWIETADDRFQKFMRNMEVDHQLLKISLAMLLVDRYENSIRKNNQLEPVIKKLIAGLQNPALQNPILERSGNVELSRLTLLLAGEQGSYAVNHSLHDLTLESIKEN